MEWRIKQLLKRLNFLGYCPFEIKNIVRDAIGNDRILDIRDTPEAYLLVRHLEYYEQMGSFYLRTYSK
jgi:hypothetical protein